MAEFDAVGDQFIGYYGSTRGHVREVLTRENLSEYLPSVPSAIMDIGGGDGRDAEWLASLGYDVTLVDPSAGMVAKAKRRFKKSGVDVKVHNMEPDEIAEHFQGQEFDVVLSHGVLMYCENDPEGHLHLLSQLAREGATISLLTKGFGGALDRALHKQDTGMVADLIENEKCVNNLGLRVWAFRPTTVEEMLGKQAMELLVWRGVRVATDHDGRDIASIPPLELKQILEVERLFGREESIRGLGQMLHYVARKR